MMAARKLNRRQADFVLAGSMGMILGLALAFFVFAMPRDVFEGIVSASGLPSMLAAAEPPLGQTARMIMAALAGGLSAILVSVLFLCIDWPAEKKQRPPRPAFSAAELGSLFDEPEAVHPMPLRSAMAILDEEPITEKLEAIPVLELEEIVDFEPEQPKAEEASSVTDEPIFLDFSAFRSKADTENKPPVIANGLSSAELAKPEPVKPAVKPMPIPAPNTIPAEESIETLMQRLEAGLERREQDGKAEAQAPTPSLSASGLRSTLDELRKMAVRR